MRLFKLVQFGSGARASVWGKRQAFPGTFTFSGHHKRGKFVGGGNVFKRRGENSRPIKALYGPSVLKEMVQGFSARAFEDASLGLSRAIEREIKVLTDGIVT